MTVFDIGVLNIPNPSATTLEQAVQQFNQNFQMIDYYCVNKRDIFFETIEINNANSGSTIIKSTKISNVKFNATDSALSVLLPPASSLKDGDKITFYDSVGNADTYNLTINRNSHLINGQTNNYVINTEKGWVELTFINANIGFWITNNSERVYFKDGSFLFVDTGVLKYTDSSSVTKTVSLV